jgi:DNA-binding MltR family transcriptional regulator
MIDNDKLFDTWYEEGRRELDSLKPFWKAHESASDRAVAIVSAILLDNLLERLIKTSYVKDPNVNTIFKDEHILRSFHTKISVAYFSGLIPKDFYHDLKLICDIRNKFAHDVVADLKFDDERIVRRINQFSQINEELAKIYPPRLRFALTVSHIAGLLLAWCQLLSKVRLPNLVETLKLKEKQFAKYILTPEQLQNILESKTDKPR